MRLSEFDFTLPPGRIAQVPIEPRDAARLLVYDRSTGSVTHVQVRDLPHFLPNGTVLVGNDSRVRHARFAVPIPGKPGKSAEVLILHALPDQPSGTYACLIGGPPLSLGEVVPVFHDRQLSQPTPISAVALQRVTDANRVITWVQFTVLGDMPLELAFDRFGSVPLPPYIHAELRDRDRYQTTYAAPLGSAAAPTAGLHFTPSLLDDLREHGFGWETVTLHVGLGTFLPLQHDVVGENRLHAEETVVSAATAHRLTSAREEGRPLLAIGTTSCRTLEAHSQSGVIQPGAQSVDLFITPGYRFQSTSALLTNFHTPRSSLLLLVSAFLIQDPQTAQPLCSPEEAAPRLLSLYDTALTEGYRFYSFGDAMLVL